jgi:hypothetical protein
MGRYSRDSKWIALGLAEAGADVAVFGRNDERNHGLLSELKAIGAQSIAVMVDVTIASGSSRG